MSSISKSAFKKFLDQMPFGKVVQKTKNAHRGQRLWPSQTSKNDKKYNFRADKGSKLPDGRQEIIIQANKNADDKGVRESAQKDSHRIVAKVAVDPVKDPQGDSINEDALNSFEENN
ncbi:hypothetical protein L228DRAFT_280744 [Xylona heveae TC161]|uniref:Uncharacterized protein n=1 Tax=Xylona heveae (strain CBS 132557 / TC161) TaxID=1328760 RepID=A0A165IXG0_XYLHT|nr:hypothetical protein L228DRAFT_280744 [Xylona heveae TC161]KZF25506.1 hypothetical protein L228DRAFT_280744 [Xylona heveae TC161]